MNKSIPMKIALIFLFVFSLLKSFSQGTLNVYPSKDSVSCDGHAGFDPYNMGGISGNYYWTDVNGNILLQNSLIINGLCPGDYSFHYDQVFPSTYSNVYNFTIETIPQTSICFNSSLAVTIDNPVKVNYGTNYSTSNTNNLIDGVLTTNTTGGQLPYKYLWSYNGEEGVKQSVAMGLDVGFYSVIITDANGCSISISDSVDVDADTVSILCDFIANVSFLNTDINSCNGFLEVIQNGGVAPFEYYWGNGDTTQSITNACNDLYYLTVLDSRKCVQIFLGITISQPLTGFVVPFSNNQNCNGSAKVIPLGGNPPYSYIFNGLTTADSISNLCSGSYFVTIKDLYGRSLDVPFIISDSINTYFTYNFQNTQAIDTLVSSPIENCTIDFQNIDSIYIQSMWIASPNILSTVWGIVYNDGTLDTIHYNYPFYDTLIGNYSFGLQVYCVQKSISSNFTAFSKFYLDQNLINFVAPNFLDDKIAIFPNPSNTFINIYFQDLKLNHCVIYDMSGRIVFEKELYNEEEQIDISQWEKGYYLIKIQNSEKIFSNKIFKN